MSKLGIYKTEVIKCVVIKSHDITTYVHSRLRDPDLLKSHTLCQKSLVGNQKSNIKIQYYSIKLIGFSLLCSKIYLLFLPKLLNIFTHYSFLFLQQHHLFLFSIVPMIISQCRSDYILFMQQIICLLTALIKHLTVLLEYINPLQTRWQCSQQAFGKAWALPGMPFGYTTV